MTPKKGLPRGPAAARAGLSPAAQETLSLSTAAIKVFEQALGGRQRLADILATGASDPAVERVLNYLLDVTYDDMPLPRLCALAGVTVADLFKAFQRAALVRGQIRAANQLEQHVDAVMADLLHRATPYEETRTICQGTGTMVLPPPRRPPPAPVPCRACHGRGRVLVTPDLERQKLVLEMAQLLPKGGGGASATVNVVNAGPAVAGTLEQLQQGVSDALYGRT